MRTSRRSGASLSYGSSLSLTLPDWELPPRSSVNSDSSVIGEALSKPAVKVSGWNIHQGREYTPGESR